MASQDIIAGIISTDGWYIDVTFESMSSAGAYDFNFDSSNNPLSNRFVITCTDPAYLNSVATTKNRIIYGVPCKRPTATGAMRKAYSDQASPQEIVSGSDLISRIALSERIFSGSTNVVLSVESGFYNDGVNDNNALTNFSVTNNSTRGYPKTLGNWITAPMTRVVSNLHLEVVAFQKFPEAKRPCDSVLFTVTDGSTTVTQLVNEMTLSANAPVFAIPCYQLDVDVSVFTDLSFITAKFKAYPNIGTATEIRDSDDGVNTYPTPLYTNQQHRVDKSDQFGKIKVDLTNGNDTTGTVYATEALAEAGLACQTIAGAMTKLQAYHNAQFTINTAAGGTVLLTAESHSYNSNAGGTGWTEWAVIKPVSTSTKENTFINIPASNSSCCRMANFQDVTLIGTGYWNGGNALAFYFKDLHFAQTGSYTAYAMAYGFCENITGSHVYGFRILSSGFWAVVRGCNMNTHSRCAGFTAVGNRNVGLETRGFAPWNDDNAIYAYSEVGAETTTTAIGVGNSRNLMSLAIIQILAVRYNSSTEPLIMISADGSLTDTDNILIWNISTGGDESGCRANLAYNDTGTVAHPQTNWSVLNCNLKNSNNKDDTFSTNAFTIGSWEKGYNVGCKNNVIRRSADGGEWLGEFEGLNTKFGIGSAPLEIGYINDSDGGDYHLLETSPAIGLADNIIPFDLEGARRKIVEASGVYIYGSPAPEPPTPSGKKFSSIKYIIGNLPNHYKKNIIGEGA